MSIEKILSKATLNSLEHTWTELNWLKDHSRLPETEDLNIAITAINRLRLELLPKYYVFACESCDRIYCAKVEHLQRVLERGCLCAGNETGRLLFVNIVSEPPQGSTVLEYDEE